MEREAAVASLSEPYDPGRRLRLKARVAPGADPSRLRDAFAGGASCLLSAMMADEPLEGARHRRSFHDAASGDLMVDFRVTTAVATALAAQLAPDGTISLPQPWGALAAVEWPDQPRHTRVRVVNVPAELQLRHVRQLLTMWGCIVEECQPVLNPQLGEGKIRRASAVEVVLARGSKVPATLQCKEYPQTLMRLDILTSPAPLRPEPNGDVTAGKRTFAAAVAANAGQYIGRPLALASTAAKHLVLQVLPAALPRHGLSHLEGGLARQQPQPLSSQRYTLHSPDQPQMQALPQLAPHLYGLHRWRQRCHPLRLRQSSLKQPWQGCPQWQPPRPQPPQNLQQTESYQQAGQE